MAGRGGRAACLQRLQAGGADARAKVSAVPTHPNLLSGPPQDGKEVAKITGPKMSEIKAKIIELAPKL